MAANAVQIGEELTGSSGASSPAIHFRYNYYLANGLWYPQGEGALGPSGVTYSNPPQAQWIPPGQVGGSTGGDFETTCC